MEWKIGEIRQVDDEWYQCIRDITCINCGFNNKGCLANKHITGDCSGRLDGASVVFKKLEKVGEPYIFSNMAIHNITMQRYKVFVKPIFTDNSIITTYNMVNETISIEIKNKEDMKENEENKYDGKMDKECIPLCDALNSLPDVETTESCCGHCKDRFMVFFTCNNPHSLAIIARVFDRRYIGTSQPWYIELQTKDSGAYDYFIHSETKYDSEEVMMKDINQIIENIKYWCDDKFASHFKGCDDKPTLTQFDINSAKQGKSVRTRDGRKARIICFDRKDNTPIVALIERVDGIEILQCVHNDGKCFHYETSNNDLMMLSEKKEGWVNLTGSLSHNPHILDVVWDTKEEALDFRRKAPINANIIATGKITWEE